MKKYESKIEEQNRKIEMLESSLSARQNVVDNLLIQCDNNEQYSRRSCLRINGVEFKKDGNDDVLGEIKRCYEEVGLQFDKKIIDRAHRIGRDYVNKNGKTSKQIIIKYKFWEDRSEFYRARPRNHDKPSPFSVAIDLTRRRYELLRKTRELIKSHEEIKFSFTDINCSLGLRLQDNSLCYFNSITELNGILNKL